jgi:hypothetical protein
MDTILKIRNYTYKIRNNIIQNTLNGKDLNWDFQQTSKSQYREMLAGTFEQDVSVRLVGRQVYPCNSLVTKLLYVRHCVFNTTLGEKILYLCEGTRNRTLWKIIEWVDCVMHYVDAVLLSVFCVLKVEPPQLSGQSYFTNTNLLWLFLVGPVVLHCVLQIAVVMTLGLSLSGALKFALFVHANKSEDILGMTNDFIEATSTTTAKFAYSDDQLFLMGVARSQGSVKIMVYANSWKREFYNYQGYFNCFHHLMTVIVVALAALSKQKSQPTFLITYLVWYLVYWAMVCDCSDNVGSDGNILGFVFCAGKIVECGMHLLFFPCACLCQCCCVASVSTIKRRVEQSSTIPDAVKIDYYQLPCESTLMARL